MTQMIKGFRNYLLERVVKNYVLNVEEVIGQMSMSKLLFGSIHLDEVRMKPEASQDLIFSTMAFGCEIVELTLVDMEVSIDWMSIASKSVKVHISSMKMELLLHDPHNRTVAESAVFAEAQKLRLKEKIANMALPTDVTLFSKVTGGQDITVDSVEVVVRQVDEDAPGLGCKMERLRNVPCTKAGEPTNDIDEAQRPNARLRMLDYGKRSEVGSMVFSMLPGASDNWEPEATWSNQNIVVTSLGQAAALRERITRFPVSRALLAEVQEVRTPAPVTLERFSDFVVVLSRVWASENLRLVVESELRQDGDTPTDEISEDHFAEKSDAEARPRARTRDSIVMVREQIRTRQETTADLNKLLVGCTRTARRKSIMVMKRASVVETKRASVVRSKRASSIPEESTSSVKFAVESPGSDEEFQSTSEDEEESGLDDSANDSDDFKDCEDDELLQFSKSQTKSWEIPCNEPERVGLKRIVGDCAKCELQIIGPNGVLWYNFADLKHSVDTRYDLSPQELQSIQSLFDLPKAWMEPREEVVRGKEPGMIFYGISMASFLVAFDPTVGDRSELAKVQQGVSLWQRGQGDPCFVATGPQQLMEVEVKGLTLCDRGKDEVQAMGFKLLAAITPYTPQSMGVATVAIMPICYSLEMVDVSAYHEEIGKPTLNCLVPCVRVRSVLKDIDEILKYTLTGLSETRALWDPLANNVLDGSLDKSDALALWSPAAYPENGGGARDAIACLERELELDKLVSPDEKLHAFRLKQKLADILEIVEQLERGSPAAPAGRTIGSQDEEASCGILSCFAYRK